MAIIDYESDNTLLALFPIITLSLTAQTPIPPKQPSGKDTLKGANTPGKTGGISYIMT